MRKRRCPKIIGITLLIISLIIIAYPFVSDFIQKEKTNKAIEAFDEAADNIVMPSESSESDESSQTAETAPVSPRVESYEDDRTENHPDIARLYADSKAYNERLKDNQDMGSGFTASVLELYDYGIYDGMYGYVYSDSIGMQLPIYLGATEYNMANGAAHISNTSLPIGGKGSHSVMVGHTGYIGRTFFDAIRYLEEGDTVKVRNYFGTLTYKVISYEEIGATDTGDLYIDKEKDLLTLITCARYGTRRYRVTCERI